MTHALNTKGKPIWQKPLIILGNLTTLWKCSECGDTYPHHPLRGHRINHSHGNVCKFCAQEPYRGHP